MNYVGVALGSFVGSFVGVALYHWRTVRALWREFRGRTVPF